MKLKWWLGIGSLIAVLHIVAFIAVSVIFKPEAEALPYKPGSGPWAQAHGQPPMLADGGGHEFKEGFLQRAVKVKEVKKLVRPVWVEEQIGEICAWGDILFEEDTCLRLWVIMVWGNGKMSLRTQYDKRCCPNGSCFDNVGLPSPSDVFYGDVLSDPADLEGYLMSELPIVAVAIREWSPFLLQ